MKFSCLWVAVLLSHVLTAEAKYQSTLSKSKLSPAFIVQSDQFKDSEILFDSKSQTYELINQDHQGSSFAKLDKKFLTVFQNDDVLAELTLKGMDEDPSLKGVKIEAMPSQINIEFENQENELIYLFASAHKLHQSSPRFRSKKLLIPLVALGGGAGLYLLYKYWVKGLDPASTQETHQELKKPLQKDNKNKLKLSQSNTEQFDLNPYEELPPEPLSQKLSDVENPSSKVSNSPSLGEQKFTRDEIFLTKNVKEVSVKSEGIIDKKNEVRSESNEESFSYPASGKMDEGGEVSPPSPQIALVKKLKNPLGLKIITQFKSGDFVIQSAGSSSPKPDTGEKSSTHSSPLSQELKANSFEGTFSCQTKSSVQAQDHDESHVDESHVDESHVNDEREQPSENDENSEEGEQIRREVDEKSDEARMGSDLGSDRHLKLESPSESASSHSKSDASPASLNSDDKETERVDQSIPASLRLSPKKQFFSLFDDLEDLEVTHSSSSSSPQPGESPLYQNEMDRLLDLSEQAGDLIELVRDKMKNEKVILKRLSDLELEKRDLNEANEKLNTIILELKRALDKRVEERESQMRFDSDSDSDWEDKSE